jgi:Na+/H+ antiporter NhaA
MERQELLDRTLNCKLMIVFFVVVGLMIALLITASSLSHPNEGFFHAFAALLTCWLVPDCIYSMLVQIDLCSQIIKGVEKDIALVTETLN